MSHLTLYMDDYDIDVCFHSTITTYIDFMRDDNTVYYLY